MFGTSNPRRRSKTSLPWADIRSPLHGKDVLKSHAAEIETAYEIESLRFTLEFPSFTRVIRKAVARISSFHFMA